MSLVEKYPALQPEMRIFFDEGRVPIVFFSSPIHHSSSVTRNFIFFGVSRVPNEYFWDFSRTVLWNVVRKRMQFTRALNRSRIMSRGASLWDSSPLIVVEDIFLLSRAMRGAKRLA